MNFKTLVIQVWDESNSTGAGSFAGRFYRGAFESAVCIGGGSVSEAPVGAPSLLSQYL